MKQGVKIYKYLTDELGENFKNKVNPELVAGGGRFKSMFELVQADMRKQNQLGWYVHQVIKEAVGDSPQTSGNDIAWMVIYRRDEEM